MRMPPVVVGRLVMKQAKTESSVLNCSRLFGSGLTVFAPDEDADGTVSIYVTSREDAADLGTTGAGWRKLQSGGSDVVVGTGDAVPLDFLGWAKMKLISTSAQAAEREFVVMSSEEIQ